MERNKGWLARLPSEGRRAKDSSPGARVPPAHTRRLTGGTSARGVSLTCTHSDECYNRLPCSWELSALDTCVSLRSSLGDV